MQFHIYLRLGKNRSYRRDGCCEEILPHIGENAFFRWGRFRRRIAGQLSPCQWSYQTSFSWRYPVAAEDHLTDAAAADQDLGIPERSFSFGEVTGGMCYRKELTRKEGETKPEVKQVKQVYTGMTWNDAIN